MILEEETFDKFGYYPSDLKPKSHKRILVACDDCGKIREICKDSYRDFCGSCAHKGEKHYLFRKHLSKETREKISKVNKGGHFSEETRKKIGNAERGERNHMFGKHHSKETRKKISIARQHQHFPTHHTKPELIFESICKRNNLDFHYVGDGSLWIGKKGEKQLNPDFIEANGKKICIEIMGAYWHSRLLNRNLREDALLPFREKHYKKYKWIPVFIWDTDLLREDAEQFVLNQLEKGDAI